MDPVHQDTIHHGAPCAGCSSGMAQDVVPATCRPNAPTPAELLCSGRCERCGGAWVWPCNEARSAPVSRGWCVTGGASTA